MNIVDEKKCNLDLIEDVLYLLLVAENHNPAIMPPGRSGTHTSRLVDGSTLVFLPGIGEIRSLYERLNSSSVFGNRNQFHVLPMHSTISSREQKKVFIPSKPGCRKIILATNICEASITIPDCVAVIDSGLERSIVHNIKTLTPTLVTDWCSKASAKQRMGRVSFMPIMNSRTAFAKLVAHIFCSGRTHQTRSLL